jgi:hypothetical protein
MVFTDGLLIFHLHSFVLIQYSILFLCHLIPNYSHGAGKTVSVDEKTNIVVPEDRYGLYAIDTLDPDMVKHYFIYLVKALPFTVINFQRFL